MPAEKQPLKITDPVLALDRMKRWCAYQERNQQEARDKLFAFGLWPEAVEQIISQLIEENFLNEERFAIAFARGKFRIKKWGRQKITAELKKKRITDYCIRKALQQLDGDDYLHTLKQVLQAKEKTIKEPNALRKSFRLVAYAMSRGFERDLILDVLKAGDH